MVNNKKDKSKEEIETFVEILNKRLKDKRILREK